MLKSSIIKLTHIVFAYIKLTNLMALNGIFNIFNKDSPTKALPPQEDCLKLPNGSTYHG